MTALEVAYIVGGVLSGGGLVAIINAVTRRRLIKVEVADRLNEATLEWAEAMKSDNAETRKELAETRKELTEARRDAAEIRRDLTVARHEAEALADDLRRLRTAILDPSATLERLRFMVGGSSGENGSHVP